MPAEERNACRRVDVAFHRAVFVEFAVAIPSVTAVPSTSHSNEGAGMLLLASQANSWGWPATTLTLAPGSRGTDPRERKKRVGGSLTRSSVTGDVTRPDREATCSPVISRWVTDTLQVQDPTSW
jgi:hypothetical protein